jgi:hypothetical protein
LREELADVREGMHSVLHALIDSKHVSLREKAVLELLQNTGARLHEVVQMTVGGYQNEGIAGQALVVNKGSQFQGGQDARDFTTVTQADIDRPAAMLKAQVAQSMQAALGQQLAPGEQLQKAPCASAVAADPAIGQEASSVRVTVSETCSGFAYNSQQLTARGAKLLTAQALRLLGNGYARFGNITVSVTKAAIEGQTAVLTFTCQGTWAYRINAARIEALVSGKPRLAALQLHTQCGI